MYLTNNNTTRRHIRFTSVVHSTQTVHPSIINTSIEIRQVTGNDHYTAPARTPVYLEVARRFGREDTERIVVADHSTGTSP